MSIGRFICRFPSRCFAVTVVRVVSVIDFRVVVLRQPLYGSFQLSISESLFCGNRCTGRFSCRFPSRCFAATVVRVVSVVDFRVVVLRQPLYGSFQLSISESLFCGNHCTGRFSCRFTSRCFAATVVRVVSVVGFRVVVLRQPLYGSFQLSISKLLFCGNRRTGCFSCQFPSRCFAATVVRVVSVVDFRVVVLRQPLYGSFQLSISESLFCGNRCTGHFSCRFPSRCFAATVARVVSVVDFRVVVLRQPWYGSFQLSISESLFCGNRGSGSFSCRFPSRCFAATVVRVVSVVDFRVVVLRQPLYGSFQLSISESLFCGNRGAGRFSCRFPSRCFAATVVQVVSVVDFRVVVLRQPLYGSFQLSISESLFCGNRCTGRFSCPFPSRCFAATVARVVSVVDFRVVVLRQPWFGSFQLSISVSLFCGNRCTGRFCCRFPSRCFAATVVRVISFVDFRVVVLRQPLHGSFQLSITESLFCGNRGTGRFNCRFPSRCFAATVVRVVSVVDFRVVVLRQPLYGSFQLSISESLFCGNRCTGRFSCRFPSRCFAATVVRVVSVVDFRVVVLRQPLYGSFLLSISESLFCGNRCTGRFSCRFPSRCFAATVVQVVSVVVFRVVVLRQPLYGSFQLSISESLFCGNRCTGRFSCRFPSRCFAATVARVVSVVDFRVVVLRQPWYGSFQLSISESLFCGNRGSGRFSCRFQCRCFAATVVRVVSVVDFRVVVLRQPWCGSFQLSISESLFCGNRGTGRFSCRFPSRCFAATVVRVVSVVDFRVVVLRQPWFGSFQLSISVSLFCGNRCTGRFSCRFPSRCFAATVVRVVSVVDFRVVVLRQPLYGSLQLSISESLFCCNRCMDRFSCRFPSRCFAATVVRVVSVVDFRVVVLRQPWCGSFQLSISESLFCGNRCTGRFSCRFPSRCFAATVVRVVSVVDFRVVVLRQPLYGSFQLSISESLFCGNRCTGRFSYRFPSRCFAATVVRVVSVVDFRVVVLRQPLYGSFQLSISESLFCGNRCTGRFSCRFPSRCFAATVVRVVSVVDFRVVVLRQPWFGSFQLSISVSLFCGNRCTGRFSCRFPSRCFAATVVRVVSVVDFRVVVLRQPWHGSFQLSISESLFCGNRGTGRFSCRFPSRCFAATVVRVVSVVDFSVVVLRQPLYGSFQLSISESLFCGNRGAGRFSCRFPSRCFAATVVRVVAVVDFRVVVLLQPLYGSFQLSISESLFCGNRCAGRFSCRFPSRCFAATVVRVVSVVDFRVVVLRQPLYGSFQLSISESLFCGNRCTGRFSCRFPSRCFAATVVRVVSVVDFRVVVLRQPWCGSFQLSISESLFCGNRCTGRFSCRFPSRCFAATVVRVVSVVDFRFVVLRQPLYGSFQLSISESLFCGNRGAGRFSCRFPSRCFAATVVRVVSVVTAL